MLGYNYLNIIHNVLCSSYVFNDLQSFHIRYPLQDVMHVESMNLETRYDHFVWTDGYADFAKDSPFPHWATYSFKKTFVGISDKLTFLGLYDLSISNL